MVNIKKILFVSVVILALATGCGKLSPETSGKAKFTLKEVKTDNCLGKFTVSDFDYGSGSFSIGWDKNYRDLQSSSQGFIQDWKIESIETEDDFIQRLQFDYKNYIKKSCLRVKKYLGGRLICEDCQTDIKNKNIECILNYDWYIEECPKACEEKYEVHLAGREDCKKGCTKEQAKDNVIQEVIYEVEFELEPTCKSINIQLENTGSKSFNVWFGEPKIITESGKEIDTFKGCTQEARLDIYPDVKKDYKFCTLDFDEKATLYLNVRLDDGETDQISLHI